MSGGPDPVSWLMIEPGWRVLAAGGDQVGYVASVEGEVDRDIFDGLEIRHHLIGHEVYVPSEEVGEIVPGEVRLTVTAAELRRRPRR
jgi:hypothetical protein